MATQPTPHRTATCVTHSTEEGPLPPTRTMTSPPTHQQAEVQTSIKRASHALERSLDPVGAYRARRAPHPEIQRPSLHKPSNDMSPLSIEKPRFSQRQRTGNAPASYTSIRTSRVQTTRGKPIANEVNRGRHGRHLLCKGSATRQAPSASQRKRRSPQGPPTSAAPRPHVPFSRLFSVPARKRKRQIRSSRQARQAQRHRMPRRHRPSNAESAPPLRRRWRSRVQVRNTPEREALPVRRATQRTSSRWSAIRTKAIKRPMLSGGTRLSGQMPRTPPSQLP